LAAPFLFGRTKSGFLRRGTSARFRELDSHKGENFPFPRTVHGRRPAIESREGANMIGWAVTFLVIALIAAVLGFGGLAGTAIGIAKIIFFVAIILFVISTLFGFMRGRRPPIG
jgi:uncharacterized membrane protein YtjA (UPF0391 family)